MSRAIPDRWLNYTPVGCPIEGTRFVAFKVPLRPNVNKSVDVDNRLDDIILLEKLPNLGFIIDLTNTKRYYDPETFRNRGVQHLKILVPGRVVPPKKLVQTFNDAVFKFLHENKDNDKLIGVHCTHGVNRTGFFICNYMISQLKINPIDAIKRFSDARGHSIERENYINALNKTSDRQSEHPNRRNSGSKPTENSSHNFKSQPVENTPFASSDMNRNWRVPNKSDVNVRSHNPLPRNDDATNWRQRGGDNMTRPISRDTRNMEYQQYDNRGSRRNLSVDIQNSQRGDRRRDNTRFTSRGDVQSDDVHYNSRGGNGRDDRRGERRKDNGRYTSRADGQTNDIHYDSRAVNRRDDRRSDHRKDSERLTAHSDDMRYNSRTVNRRDDRHYSSGTGQTVQFSHNSTDARQFFNTGYEQYQGYHTQQAPLIAPLPVSLPLPLPLPLHLPPQMSLPLHLPPQMPLPMQTNGYREFQEKPFAHSESFLLGQPRSRSYHNYNQNKSWNKANNTNARPDPRAFYSRKPNTNNIDLTASSSIFGRSSINNFIS